MGTIKLIKKTLCMLMLISFVAAISVTSVSAARDGFGGSDKFDNKKFDRFDNKRFDRFDNKRFDRFDNKRFDRFDNKRFDRFDNKKFDRFDRFDKYDRCDRCDRFDRCKFDFGGKCNFFGFDFFGKNKCWC